MSQPDQILYEFEKPRVTVRAYINQFRGKRYAHIREFVEPRDRPGAPLIAKGRHLRRGGRPGRAAGVCRGAERRADVSAAAA